MSVECDSPNVPVRTCLRIFSWRSRLRFRIFLLTLQNRRTDTMVLLGVRRIPPNPVLLLALRAESRTASGLCGRALPQCGSHGSFTGWACTRFHTGIQPFSPKSAYIAVRTTYIIRSRHRLHKYNLHMEKPTDPAGPKIYFSDPMVFRLKQCILLDTVSKWIQSWSPTIAPCRSDRQDLRQEAGHRTAGKARARREMRPNRLNIPSFHRAHAHDRAATCETDDSVSRVAPRSRRRDPSLAAVFPNVVY